VLPLWNDSRIHEPLLHVALEFFETLLIVPNVFALQGHSGLQIVKVCDAFNSHNFECIGGFSRMSVALRQRFMLFQFPLTNLFCSDHRDENHVTALRNSNKGPLKYHSCFP